MQAGSFCSGLLAMNARNETLLSSERNLWGNSVVQGVSGRIDRGIQRGKWQMVDCFLLFRKKNHIESA